FGATYYVAPSGGTDGGTGDFGTPFATISHAISVAGAGDTIYLRGGNYNLSSTISISSSKSGTAANPINLLAYSGDATAPVLDFRAETFSSNNSGLRGFDVQGNYWHFKGFTVQYAADNGIMVSGSNNTFEQLVTRQNQDSGLALQGPSSGARLPSNNLVLNCDSYGNFDFGPTNGPHGENADGFIAKFRQLGTGNYFIGDRAYNNGDDGYDFWQSPNRVTVIGSQAFHNGLTTTSIFRTAANGTLSNYAGDGNGFKLGQDSSTHVLLDSMAWGNGHNGFDANGNATQESAGGGIQHGLTLYNNTSFNNARNGSGSNFAFSENFAHVLVNNISLNGSASTSASTITSHDSWNSGFSVSASDFLSTADPATDGVFHPAGTGADRSGTTAPTLPVVPARLADGSLPYSTFLRLNSNSPLIDAGIASFTDAAGNPVILSTNSTLLNFTGVSIALSGYTGLAPDLGVERALGPAGDFNQDGHINSADIALAMTALSDTQNYQTSHGLTDPNLFLAYSDVNKDGVFNNSDLQSLLTILISGGGSADPVPEPTSFTMALLCVAALCGARRILR
ncbi:MAG TPA: dockerin type I domain-containing protein, partial [Pirellulales bacterium]